MYVEPSIFILLLIKPDGLKSKYLTKSILFLTVTVNPGNILQEESLTWTEENIRLWLMFSQFQIYFFLLPFVTTLSGLRKRGSSPFCHTDKDVCKCKHILRFLFADCWISWTCIYLLLTLSFRSCYKSNALWNQISGGLVISKEGHSWRVFHGIVFYAILRANLWFSD